MRTCKLVIATALVTIGVAGPLNAEAGRDKATEADKVLDAILRCAETREPVQRLTCVDAEIERLKSIKSIGKPLVAETSRSEREQLPKTPLPIISVSELESGRWLFITSDKSVWRTDDIVRIPPTTGQNAVFLKGAFGSVMVKFADNPAVRVKRLK